MTCILRDLSKPFRYFNGKIQTITVNNPTKMAQIKIYGANKDVIQKMGLSNREYTLDGYVTESADVTFLNECVGEKGEFEYYSNALSMDLIGTQNNPVTIYFKNLVWKDEGSKPMERNFSLTMVEIKQ